MLIKLSGRVRTPSVKWNQQSLSSVTQFSNALLPMDCSPSGKLWTSIRCAPWKA